jgi:hypothetical protein
MGRWMKENVGGMGGIDCGRVDQGEYDRGGGKETPDFKWNSQLGDRDKRIKQQQRSSSNTTKTSDDNGQD